MLDNNSLIKKYNKLPEWLRWVLFLPISEIFSIILWFFMDSAARYVGAYKFVLAILHPVIVQVSFIILIFYTVPRGKLKWVIAFIVLRSLFLVFFIAQPILSFLGTEMIYDWIFFKELIGEILTLFASIVTYRELKKIFCKFPNILFNLKNRQSMVSGIFLLYFHDISKKYNISDKTRFPIYSFRLI